jgi:hypothetical protein
MYLSDVLVTSKSTATHKDSIQKDNKSQFGEAGEKDDHEILCFLA